MPRQSGRRRDRVEISSGVQVHVTVSGAPEADPTLRKEVHVQGLLGMCSRGKSGRGWGSWIGKDSKKAGGHFKLSPTLPGSCRGALKHKLCVGLGVSLLKARELGWAALVSGHGLRIQGEKRNTNSRSFRLRASAHESSRGPKAVHQKEW